MRHSHDFGHHEGRRGRFFSHGGLRFVLLKLIADKPSHGYELIRTIEDRLQGLYSPSPGVVYPTLTLLEEQGYITQAEQGGGRKLCAATPAGLALLQENRAAVDELFARMGGDGKPPASRPPQIERALHNFKMAVRLRLSRDALSDEQAHAIAAILDEAARNIERT